MQPGPLPGPPYAPMRHSNGCNRSGKAGALQRIAAGGVSTGPLTGRHDQVQVPGYFSLDLIGEFVARRPETAQTPHWGKLRSPKTARRGYMNKSELIEAVATAANISKTAPAHPSKQ